MTVAYWPPWRDQPYLNDLHAALRRRGLKIERATPWQLGRGGRSVFHVHWPEYSVAGRSAIVCAVRTAYLLLLHLIAAARGVPVVVTVHNLGSHEARRPRLERIVTSAQLRRARRVVVLSRGGISRLTARFPVVDAGAVDVVPLGEWSNRFDASDISPASPTDLVFFGRVRAYKGLDQLTDAVDAIERDLTVRVVGKWDPGATLDRLRERLRDRNDFLVEDRHVSDAEATAFLAASSLAVFPFTAIENSSSMLAALGAGTPVLAPRLGALEELAADANAGWVQLYDPPLRPEHLEDALARTRGLVPPAFPPGTRSWDDVAQIQANVYEHVLHDRRGTR